MCYLYTKKRFSPPEISEELGYSINRIKRCLRQRNVRLRNRKEANILTAEKGKFYMQTEKGKREHGRKMKGRSYNRIYEYNRSIFKFLNKHTAYLLGYICADGCVSKEGKKELFIKEHIVVTSLDTDLKIT